MVSRFVFEISAGKMPFCFNKLYFTEIKKIYISIYIDFLKFTCYNKRSNFNVEEYHEHSRNLYYKFIR